MVSPSTVARGWRVATLIALGQLAVTLMIAAGFLAASGMKAGRSALLGGAISTAAGLVFAFAVFSASGSNNPKQMLRNVYRGEAAKLGLTVVLLTAALKLTDVVALPFFIAYIAPLFVYWIALSRARIF